MKVLTIGSDRKLFEEGSAVRARAVEYATLFDELHIIVFRRKFEARNSKSETNSNIKIQISKNCWIYPTNSLNRWLYIFDAVRLGKKIIENCLALRDLEKPEKLEIRNCVVTSQDPFECGLVAWRLAKRFKLSLHIQIHTDFLSPYFISSSILNRIRVLMARKILPHADAIRVVSRRIFDSLRELRITNYELRTRILPIFTDLEKFREVKLVTNLQTKYPDWDFIILMTTRLSKEKNVGFAFEILRELLKKYPKVGMVIVGAGPLGDSLKSKVESLKLGGNVVFEGWQDDLVSYYKTANLFLQTSLYEGFGLSLLEAVSSGCPSVSSDVGIAPELLNHKDHSFVCPVNDHECFVRKISELIDDNQLRAFFSLEIAPSAIKPFIQTRDAYLGAYRASLEQARG